MPRNIQFQILRGTQGQLLTLQGGIDPDTGSPANPLQFGEMYFAIDTNAFFLGTPGRGVGYIQIGDQAEVNERLDHLIVIMECIRRAMVKLACEGKQANELDFDPNVISQELAQISPIGR